MPSIVWKLNVSFNRLESLHGKMTRQIRVKSSLRKIWLDDRWLTGIWLDIVLLVCKHDRDSFILFTNALKAQSFWIVLMVCSNSVLFSLHTVVWFWLFKVSNHWIFLSPSLKILCALFRFLKVTQGRIKHNKLASVNQWTCHVKILCST